MDDLREVGELLSRIAELQVQAGDALYSAPGGTSAAMENSHKILGPREIHPDLVKERLSKALRKRIGQRREYAFDEVSQLTGEHENSLRNWASGENLPVLSGFLKLCALFGPAFASEVMGVIDMSVMDAHEAQATQTISITQLVKMLPDLRRMVDGLESSFPSEEEGD